MKRTPSFSTLPRLLGLAVTLGLLAPALARAQNWDSVPFVDHSVYQAVMPVEGTGTYTSSFLPSGNAFPIRLRGVVLNNNEDWLNPAPSTVGIGGQAEIFVQAINLDGTAYDTDPDHDFNDFGGTACWMGQNYGIMKSDPGYNYTDAEWIGELTDLRLYGGTAANLVRAGDLIEIRARAGLNYAGKMNVNESHINDANEESDVDWEIVVLANNYVSDLKTISTEATVAELLTFNPSRKSGGEHYQSTMVTLADVAFPGESLTTDGDQWTKVHDRDGREIEVYLGLNDSFDGLSLDGWYDVTGILNQVSGTGVDGYYLMVMNAGDIAAVPEPSTWLLATLIVGLGLWRIRRR